jgi:predicted  nucleic acid-binding Zn-ribbon protein
VQIKPEVIKTSIESLLRLQEIDGQLFILNAELKNPPPEFKEIQTKLDEAQKTLKNIDRVFRDVDRDRRALELRNLTLKDDIKRAEAKRRDVRNTKEEFAANKEYETFQKKAAENDKILEEKQKVASDKQTSRDVQQKIVTDLEEKLKAFEEKRRSRALELDAEIQKLEAQRDAHISLVDEDVFTLYERVQKIRRGTGIALVKGTTCSGCFVTIPPQLRHRLEKLDEIITCPSCSRILYPSDADQKSSAESIAS